jgi:hypothetical protein
MFFRDSINNNFDRSKNNFLKSVKKPEMVYLSDEL